MFGEMGAKRQLAGIGFGGGLALFAAQSLSGCSDRDPSNASECIMPDQPTYRPYTRRAPPLTVCGVDRRLFSWHS